MHENYGFYGNGNSPNVEKHIGAIEDNSKIPQASSMKLGNVNRCKYADYTQYLFFCRVKFVITMTTEIINSQNVSKYMDANNSRTFQASLTKLGIRKRGNVVEKSSIFFAKYFQYPNR